MAKPLTPGAIAELKRGVNKRTGNPQAKDLFDGGGGSAVPGSLRIRKCKFFFAVPTDGYSYVLVGTVMQVLVQAPFAVMDLFSCPVRPYKVLFRD